MTISDMSGGGAEREFSNLLRGLDRDVFDIRVCLWRPDTVYPCPPDIPVTVLHKHRPWDVFRTIRRLAATIDELRPDVLFSVLQYPNLVAGSALRRCSHRPRWVCRFLLPPELYMTGFKKVWAGRVLGAADRVAGCSRGIAGALVKHLGTDPARTMTLHNPMDLERVAALAGAALPIGRPEDTFVVAHAGRLVRQKNQSLLLKSFAHLRGRPRELWMLGRGPRERELRRLARRLGIASRVRWLGFQENPFPFIRAADCFALSSNSEGLPTVIVEAMVCGTPVVSTLCPYGPDELIRNGASGMLVPMDDPAAMAAAIQKIADDPQLGRRLAQEAERFVRDTFWGERTVEEHARLFRQLAEEGPA
jgi:glycosyltransferase involved in cell wall biosynthesis